MFLGNVTEAIRVEKKGGEVSIAKIGTLKSSSEKIIYKCGMCGKKKFQDFYRPKNLYLCMNCGWLNRKQ